jgi:hypothetical protein
MALAGGFSKDVITFENLTLQVGDFTFMEATTTSDDNLMGIY